MPSYTAISVSHSPCRTRSRPARTEPSGATIARAVNTVTSRPNTSTTPPRPITVTANRLAATPPRSSTSTAKLISPASGTPVPRHQNTSIRAPTPPGRGRAPSSWASARAATGRNANSPSR